MRRRHRRRFRRRAPRPADDGHHRRQRQHAVPVRFGPRRDHRQRRRAAAGHPSGHRRQARQERRRAKSSAMAASPRAIAAMTGSASSTSMSAACPAEQAEALAGAAEEACSARCAPPSPTGSRCWPGSTRRSPSSAMRRCRSTRTRVTEAIAFLEWLRDDNFTFLGMREFNYSGGEKSGTLERADKPGLGILADPDVLVLRRGAEAVTHDAGNPRLPARARAADRHQGQRQVGRCTAASISTISASRPTTSKGALAGELRIVGLFTSTAYTRSVMKIPYLRSKAADGHRQVRLQSRRPFRQGADQRAGKLSARRAVPDRRADAAQACRGDPGAWSSGRASGRWCASTSSTASSPSSSSCRATATTFDRPREDRRLSQDGVRRPAVGLLPGLPGRRAGARPFHHRPLRRQDAEGRAGGDRGGDPRHRAHLGGRAARGGRRIRRRCRACRASPRVSRKATATAFTAGGGAGRRRPHRRDRRRAIRSPSTITAMPTSSREQAALKIYHHGSAGGAVAARADAGEHRLPRHQRAHLRGRRRTERQRSSSTTWSSRTPSATPIDLADGGKLFEDVFLSVWRGDADNDGYNALAQTAGLRSARDRHPARLWPLSAAGRHPAEPGFHRRRAQPLSRHRARRCMRCSSRASTRPQAAKARSPPSISRPRSRTRWKTCPTSTTTPSSAATST